MQKLRILSPVNVFYLFLRNRVTKHSSRQEITIEHKIHGRYRAVPLILLLNLVRCGMLSIAHVKMLWSKLIYNEIHMRPSDL